MATDPNKISNISSISYPCVKNEENVTCDKGVEKCRQWLRSCSLSDDTSCTTESFSCGDMSLDTESDNLDENEEVIDSENVSFGDKVITRNNETSIQNNLLDSHSNYFKNVQIYKSQNVHVGNITQIYGPVYMNHFSPTLNQNIVINNNINGNKIFPVVSRLTWLAQPPLDPYDVQYFSQTPKLVIICHSASEEAYTQTENNLRVRLIQQFHIESRNWNDISYNFLVGADGSFYEGRGWKVVGAHTLGYNTHSIGICFIGCYMKTLPPESVMNKVKEFIKYGVEQGYIDKDYSLLGHCQCRSTESPGRKLFEEIKTWDRWNGSIDIHNPSPLMSQ